MSAYSTNREFDASLAAWSRARDVLAGEDALKAAGTKYLPRMDSQSDPEYEACKAPASPSPRISANSAASNQISFSGHKKSRKVMKSHEKSSSRDSAIASAYCLILSLGCRAASPLVSALPASSGPVGCFRTFSCVHRNMKPYFLLGVLLGVAVLVCAGCKNDRAAVDGVQIDKHAVVHVGMPRDQVLAALGPPARTQTWVKSEQPIFGVLESLWAELPQGAKVEIWEFPQSKGTISIYFHGASNSVWHTSFVKKGVVF
jgi:hypothetical protein